ncbi:proline-serine-threonine phosphatase-interacting protein 1-like isoform X2 [Oscarella lobularis]|uniref:proline-serine-threonine phosphatase-interacting protein 1-like isoform X2 n=1 Tax=Oscarella lobularis TaxID=121494 RepID=UPI0033132CB1
MSTSATRPLLFADYFWGTDFTSFAGFETLCTRLKQGKHTSQELEEFLKSRAKIEENYGRELTKLARQYHAKDEIGTLKATWEELKTETELVGNAHLTAAKKFISEFESVKEFKERQRTERKKSEDTVKKSQSYKKTSYDKQTRSKKSYEKSCRDSDHADEVYQKMLNLQKQKQIDDSQKKAESAKQNCQKCDTQYQDSVKTLDEARVMWEREMEICCNAFQELERERVTFLRGVLWRYSNINSQLAVDIDDLYEKLRQQLERCDPEADNNTFVESRKTGSERPPPIEYENFYTKLSMSLEKKVPSTSTSSGGSNKISGPISSFSARELPEIPVTPPTDRRDGSSTSSAGVYSMVESGKGDSLTSGGDYALVGSLPSSTSSSSRSKVRYVLVEYDYEAQGEQELTLRVGDKIEVIDMEDETWWKGRRADGREGMFPGTFVSLL